MSKVGLIFVIVSEILVLQVVALWSEAPLPGLNPLELRDQKSEAKRVDQLVVVSPLGEGESKVEAAEAPNNNHMRRLGKHHSTDKSVAGGGVILGGLITATFAAVFCYIRLTRKRDSAHDQL